MLVFKKIIFIPIILIFIYQCTQFQICDDYDKYKNQCINVQDPIIIPVDSSKTIKENSFDLYFNKKITIGVLYNNFFSFTDKDLNNLECSYEMEFQESEKSSKIIEFMEGKRIYNNNFWCFDYLGTMIYNFYKKNNIENKKYNLLKEKEKKIKLQIAIYSNKENKKTWERKIQIQNLIEK